MIALALFSAFLALYSLFPNNYPHWDELFHVLAGESWAADGTLETGNGPYTRTPLYTILIGELFKVFGPSLPVARLPAILASALWVSVTYVCMRPWAGREVAALAALGLGLCPTVVDVAKMTRFYAVHGLLFTLGAFATLHAVAGPPSGHADVSRRRRAGLLGAAGLCLLGALYFQVTTLIGVVALAAWSACFVAVRALGIGRRLLITAGIAGITGLIVMVTAAQLGVLGKAIDAYRATAGWAEHTRHEHTFYYDLMLDHYPALWPLFPVAMVYAMSRRPVLACFCATVFGIGFVLQSFGGMKAERYIAYLMPFFWAVVATAAAPLAALAWRAIRDMGARIASFAPRCEGPAAGAILATLLGCAIFGLAQFAVTNLAIARSLERLIHRVEYVPPNWAAANKLLRLDHSPQPVLLTRNPLHALYFIGDYHLGIGPEPRSPANEGELELAASAGEQRPTVSTAYSLDKIVTCNPAGVVVASEWHWQSPWGTATEIREYAKRHLEAQPAGHDYNVVIYTWSHQTPPEVDCPAWAVFDRPLRLQLRG